MSVFETVFEELPPTVPIFPLTGVLLLARGRLPLNIFEPRYLNMTADALAGDRLIGMIQPKGSSDAGEPPVYRTGCVGRIVSFEETEDDRMLITLKGVCRFDIVEELATCRGYRRVSADWSRYQGDFDPETAIAVDRDRLLDDLKSYFEVQGIAANWDAIQETPDEKLVTCLSMICPFEPSEKQALLEAPNLAERSRVLATLVEMAVLDKHRACDSVRHHQ